MRIPGLAAALTVLALCGATVRAQPAPPAAVAQARDAIRGLEESLKPLGGEGYDARARRDAGRRLTALEPLVAALRPAPGADGGAWRGLSAALDDALAREASFWSSYPDPDAPRRFPPHSADDLKRRAQAVAAAFAALYPDGAAPPAPPPAARAAARVPAGAEKAVELGVADGRAAMARPGAFYDGAKTRAAAAPVAPSGGFSANGPRGRVRLTASAAPAGLRISAVPAAPESAETRACRAALKDHPEDAAGCASSPVLTPIKAGLFDSVREQFGTIKGLATNVGFLLLGLAMSVASGFGLIAKLVVSIASVGLLLWTLPPLIKQGWDAWDKLRRTKPGDPEHARAMRTLGKIGGTVLIMALMSVIGWGVGRSLTGSATSKIAAILEAKGVKAPLTALDAAAPPALVSLLKPKAGPAAPGAALEPIPRSAKSASLVPEETLRRNAAITDRAVRVDEAMKQLGVDRSFAEKVADAHDKVPCPVGGCTPAQLRAKVEIMGRGPRADAAIRSGLAGEPPPKAPAPAPEPAPAPGAPALRTGDGGAPFLATAEFTPPSARFSPEAWSSRRGGAVADEALGARDAARLSEHVMKPELSKPSPLSYNPSRIKGGGHTEPGLADAVQQIARSAADARARYAADLETLADLQAAEAKRPLRPAETKTVRKLTDKFNREARPPAEGEHWSERAQPYKDAGVLSNGVKRVLLPEEAFDPSAWRMMQRAAKGNLDPADGYVAGGKTLFPEGWTEAQIAEAIRSVRSRPASTVLSLDGRATYFGEATANGQTVTLEVGVDAAGQIVSGFPSWNQ